MMDKIYAFSDQLEFSHDIRHNTAWESFYHSYWPGLITNIVTVATDSKFQRDGVDRLILFKNGKMVTIDEKKRRVDYGDFLIEEWSNCVFDWDTRKVIYGRKPGWTVDFSKTCDFIAYGIIPTNKIYLIPFDNLRRVCANNLDYWKTCQGCKYPIPAKNPGYTTVNLAVPWPELKIRLLEDMSGGTSAASHMPFDSIIENSEKQLLLFNPED